MAQIIARGLTSWFDKVDGSSLNFHREIYRELNMVDCDLRVLQTIVHGKIIDVTPMSLAKMINYVRPEPNKINYPYLDFQPKTFVQYADLMDKRPSTFTGNFRIGV